jgi:hypothetical protein
MPNQASVQQHGKAKQVRVVYPRSDQEWINECLGPNGDMSVHESREEAVAFAVAMIEHAGGGEVTVRGMNGEIEDRKTIRPNGGSSHVSISRGSEEENSFNVEHFKDVHGRADSAKDAGAATDVSKGEEQLVVKGRKKSRRKASPPDQE